MAADAGQLRIPSSRDSTGSVRCTHILRDRGIIARGHDKKLLSADGRPGPIPTTRDSELSVAFAWLPFLRLFVQSLPVIMAFRAREKSESVELDPARG